MRMFRRISSKLNETILRKIADLVREGIPLRKAAALVDVGPNTAVEWFKKGEAESENLNIFRKFYLAICAAEGADQRKQIAKIEKDPDWRAAAFKLERRHKEDWGRPSLNAAPPTVNVLNVQTHAADLGNILERMAANARTVNAGPAALNAPRPIVNVDSGSVNTGLGSAIPQISHTESERNGAQEGQSPATPARGAGGDRPSPGAETSQTDYWDGIGFGAVFDLGSDPNGFDDDA